MGNNSVKLTCSRDTNNLNLHLAKDRHYKDSCNSFLLLTQYIKRQIICYAKLSTKKFCLYHV